MNEAEQAAPPPMSEEELAIATRRAIAGVDRDQPACGLALSGGGIRSATFCLGLLRALAANGVLKRFDYLSTVSGGGYAGAALGRLYKRGIKVDDIEKGLASDGSLLLWWLRANGRFLIPAGMNDLLQATAFQLRGFLATQFEVAVVALLVAAAIVLPHVAIFAFGLLDFAHAWLQPMRTPWWAALPVPVFVAGVAIFAYWFSREDHEGGLLRDGLVSAAVLALVIWIALRMLRADVSTETASAQLTVMGATAVLLACVPTGYVVRLVFGAALGVTDRIVYTRWLAGSIAAFFAILVFGFADLATWLAAWLWLYGDELKLTGGAGLAVITVLAARTALPMLEKLRPSGSALPLEALANVAGLLLLALLALMWLTLMQAFVFLANDGPAIGAFLLDASGSAGSRWGVVVTVAVVYLLLTLGNLMQLNRSSLHEFYRSRLARTYVSIGNHPDANGSTDPTARFPVSPLQTNSRAITEQTRKVTQLLPNDDLTLGAYRPHDAGGPVHIVNCCINQTRDDRTGSYNADRKGIALGVSAFGMETGTQMPAPSPDLADMSLSSWVAISGAAAGSGMGSLTRPGTSALLFLSGLRLGYWWKPAKARYFTKYRALISEMLARFPGLRSHAWYVSDGGHFDNTGVYALLKRRLPVIVLADCGADPRYLFADLESLVRKARLDYAAQIEFVDPSALEDESVRPLFGTPETIGPEPGSEHLLLARIQYADRTLGALLIVKPRRLPTLPLDLVGYADRDPNFPQQTTSDQFFDEAQWESYQSLGHLLGASITPALLAKLPGWAANAPVTYLSKVATQPEARAPSRRERMVATVGTSLGFGAIASVLLAGWQIWDEHNRMAAERQRAFLEASTGMAEVLAASEGEFSTELKLRLDALVGLARASSSGEGARRQTLETLANSLAPICEAQAAGAQLECNAYLQRLRGEDVEGGPIRVALAQYWVDKSPERAEIAMAPTPAAPAESPVGMPVPAPDEPVEPSMPNGPQTGTAPPVPAGTEPATAGLPPPPAAAPVQEQTAQWTRADCRPATKTGLTLYIHVYDENERAVAQSIARQAIEAGLAVPGIQNVVRTAEQQGKTPPTRWNMTTWLYRGEDGMRCATAASGWLAADADASTRRPSQVVELPAALRAAPGIIELWVPPAPAAAE